MLVPAPSGDQFITVKMMSAKEEFEHYKNIILSLDYPEFILGNLRDLSSNFKMD